MSDLENKDLEQQEQAQTQSAETQTEDVAVTESTEKETEVAEAPMLTDVDEPVDAPFIPDADAADAQDSPFAGMLEKAAADAEESEKKKGKKKSTKKESIMDKLKAPVSRLEPKDPSEVPMRWYILQAFSGFEQRVAQALQERIKIHNMQDYFGEILVPKERVKDADKDGKRRESERKFFPGYVMVEMKMTSDSWQLVKHTERVLKFVGGTPEHPLPISKAEADRILYRLKETAEAPRPKTLFEVGEQVRAIEGAFKDFSGTVEKVDYEKCRLTVSIAIFGRATPVELEFSQVEKEV